MSRERLLIALRDQAQWCRQLGSPLYHSLLLRIADDVQAGGVSCNFLELYADDYLRSLLPLRFLAMIHRMVLEGNLPDLARFYPSCGGAFDLEGAWHPIASALRANAAELHARLPHTVQTNEVTRSCALMLGFREIARQTGLPLRLLEIGCSAGLNLRWDHYRYETLAGAWGPSDTPVVFRDNFTVPELPYLNSSAYVTDRRGCDLNPIEPTEDGRLTLLSFLWPDQMERFHQLSNAIAIARKVPAILDRADAIDWMKVQLAEPSAGVATVLFHSIVLFYFSQDRRNLVRSILSAAGERATKKAPLAWLSMERGEQKTFEVQLTLWPGGRKTLIAKSDPLSQTVEVMLHSNR